MDAALAGWDWLIGSDPGLLRLTLAARGTLSVLLTTLVAIGAGAVLHVPPFVLASAIVFSMVAPFLMREPTLRARQTTLLVLLVPAALATAATAALHGHTALGHAVSLILVFVCFLLHPRHSRMTGIGLVAVVLTYIDLYLALPPSTLPIQLLGLLGAMPIVAFASFVALPMNQAATLRRIVQAIRWRAARVLDSAHRAIDEGASMAPLRRDLAQLTEAALAADDQIALLLPAGRNAIQARLIDLELAAIQIIRALRTAPPGPRHLMRLRLHQRRMRRGLAYSLPPGRAESGSLLAALVGLGHAVHALGAATEDLAPDRAGAGQPVARPLPPAQPGPLAWRLATRVTLAAGLAMAGGMALSPDRWFWAVLTVYVMFLNARSRGDTIYRGVQRLAGTLLGIVSGVLLGGLLIGVWPLQLAVLLLATFGTYYFLPVAATAGIFCVTIMLGMLYEMLGVSLQSVLLLRLEETAIGAAVAILVAAFVLPTRTRDQVMRSGRGVLLALAASVRASRDALLDQAAPSPVSAMRGVDRQVADLRLALAPFSAGSLLLRRTALDRPFPALVESVHWARVLAAASQDAAHQTLATDDMAVLATRIEARLTDLADGRATPLSALAERLPQAGQAVVVTDARTALDRLEAAVDLVAERLAIGALEGYTLGG